MGSDKSDSERIRKVTGRLGSSEADAGSAPTDSQPTDPPLVLMVHRDSAVADKLGELIASLGFATETHRSLQEVATASRPETACCVLMDADVIEPVQTVLDSDDELHRVDSMIVVSGHLIPALKKAIDDGAVHRVASPALTDELASALTASITAERNVDLRLSRIRSTLRQLDELNDEERTVLDMLLQGKSNKNMAQLLGVSTRTVERRRHDVQRKLQAASLPEMIRLVIEAEEYAGH